jgi:hypothetical protein
MLLAADACRAPGSHAEGIKSRNDFELQLFRSLGASCGLAVSAIDLQSGLKEALPEPYASIANAAYSIPHNVDQTTLATIIPAFAHASHSIFIANVPVIVICLVGCAFVGDKLSLASRHKG